MTLQTGSSNENHTGNQFRMTSGKLQAHAPTEAVAHPNGSGLGQSFEPLRDGVSVVPSPPCEGRVRRLPKAGEIDERRMAKRLQSFREGCEGSAGLPPAMPPNQAPTARLSSSNFCDGQRATARHRVLYLHLRCFATVDNSMESTSRL